MAKKILFSSLFLFAILFAKAQDAHFSQYYAASLYMNPALAGIEKGITFNSNYRTQWRSIVLPYVTSQVSFIVPWFVQEGVKRRHIGGFGLSFYNDRAGDGNLKTLGVMGTYAHNFTLNKSGSRVVTIGGQAGFMQKSVDFTNLEWGQQFNPFVGYDPTIAVTEPNITNNVFYPDFSVGAMFFYNPQKSYLFTGMSGYAGGSVSHLNNPNESIVDGVVSRLPLLFKGQAGAEIHLSDKIDVSPNILLMNQGAAFQANGGIYLNYLISDSPIGTFSETDLIFGTWYRYGDAAIAMLGLSHKAYTVGFSYDLNTSSLRTSTRGRGAYEISLTIRQVKESKIKRFSTPRI